jgi:hypothetical protein
VEAAMVDGLSIRGVCDHRDADCPAGYGGGVHSVAGANVERILQALLTSTANTTLPVMVAQPDQSQDLRK